MKPGDLIMSCSGTMGRIAIIPDDAPNGIINQALLKLTPKAGVNNKYLKYCFEDTIAAQMNSEARGGAIKNVASVAVLKDIKIQIPSLSEQNRIVTILDYFYHYNERYKFIAIQRTIWGLDLLNWKGFFASIPWQKVQNN